MVLAELRKPDSDALKMILGGEAEARDHELTLLNHPLKVQDP